MARRVLARTAAVGLALTLVALAVISLVGLGRIRTAGETARRSQLLAQAYERAMTAVAAEESLARKYRVEPSAGVRSRHEAAGLDLVNALAEVARTGTPEDRALVADVSRLNLQYRTAIGHLFRAVDQEDEPAALRIDAAEVDPIFGVMKAEVEGATTDHEQQGAAALDELRQIVNQVFGVTTAGFAFGLIVVGSLTAVVARFQRQQLAQAAINRRQASHDSLTDLPNRGQFAFETAAVLAAASPQPAPAAVLMIDLDRFKEVNETLGHALGDQLLRQVGPRVAAVLSKGDVVSRFGADEFAVLARGLDQDGAAELAHRILAELHRTFDLDGVDVDLEARIGVAVCPAHATTAEDLLRLADGALHRAKAGSDGVVVHDPVANPSSAGFLQLLGDLRRALDTDGELALHYQPKVRLDSGEVEGAEALLRWLHPQRGMVPPVEFVPVAENTGLIIPLTYRVLEMAVTQVRAWIEQGSPIRVAVNLSTRCLVDPQLAPLVSRLLADHGVPAHLLALEVTESSIMDDPVRSLQVLEDLHRLGVRLSLDDFGTGYSSMSYLKRMPVQELKIDKSFIRDLIEDDGDAVIVRSAIDLGHNLALTVVAEGVESAEQVLLLQDMGCDIAQGYYFARPVPPDDLLPMVARIRTAVSDAAPAAPAAS